MVGCRLLRQRFKDVRWRPLWRCEGIDYPNRAEFLAVLQVLGQENLALARLRGRNDEGIPPGKGMTFLENPSAL